MSATTCTGRSRFTTCLPNDGATGAHVTGLLAEYREIVTEQVRYRDLLYQMTKRDLLLRYKQTVMGFGWAVFMPLINTIVFSVVFTKVAPVDVGVPYPLYRVLRPAILESLRRGLEIFRRVTLVEREPGHEGLLPPRDLPAFIRYSLPWSTQRWVHCSWLCSWPGMESARR